MGRPEKRLKVRSFTTGVINIRMSAKHFAGFQLQELRKFV